MHRYAIDMVHVRATIHLKYGPHMRLLILQRMFTPHLWRQRCDISELEANLSLCL
jgi:hypothetical protein